MADSTNPFLQFPKPQFATEQEQNELRALNPNTWRNVGDSTLGLGSASPVERDARTMTPAQLREKYGDQAALDYFKRNIQQSAGSEKTHYLDRNWGQAISDPLVQTGAAIVKGSLDIFGLLSSIPSGFEPNAASTALYGAGEAVKHYLNDKLVSKYTNNQNAEVQKEQILRVRDNEALRTEALNNGDSVAIADLKTIGRNLVSTVQSQRPSTVIGNTAAAVGSTVVSIPLIGQTSKAANALHRASTLGSRTQRAIAPLEAEIASLRGLGNTFKAQDRIQPRLGELTRQIDSTRQAVNLATHLPDTAFTRTMTAIPGIATMELASTASEISNQIGSMTHEELYATSEPYRIRLTGLLAEGMDEGKARKQARDAVRGDAVQEGLKTALPYVVGASALGGWLNRTSFSGLVRASEAETAALAGGATAQQARQASQAVLRVSRPNLSVGEIARDILSESVEESIQNPASQYASNVATQRYINPDQTLREGIGEAVAEGVIGAIGSTGLIQGARKFRQVGRQAAQTVADVGKRPGARRVNKADTIGLFSLNPRSLSPELAEVLAPIKGKKETIADALDTVVRGMVGKSPEQLIRRGRVINALMIEAQSRMRPYYEDDALTVIKEGTDRATARTLRDMQAQFKALTQIGIVSSAMEAAAQAISDKVTNPETQNSVTKDEYELAMSVDDFSSLKPEEIAQHRTVTQNILNNLELSDTDRTRYQIHDLVLSLAQNPIQGLEGLGEAASATSRSMLNNKEIKGWQKSTIQHIKHIQSLVETGNRNETINALEDFRSFAQHALNKAEAFKTAWQTPGEMADIAYASLDQKTRHFKNSRTQNFKTDRVFVKKSSEKSVRMAQVAFAETGILVDSFNKIVDMLPDHGVASVPVFEIPAGLLGDSKEISQNWTSLTDPSTPNRNTENETRNSDQQAQAVSEMPDQSIQQAGADSAADPENSATGRRSADNSTSPRQGELFPGSGQTQTDTEPENQGSRQSEETSQASSQKAVQGELFPEAGQASRTTREKRQGQTEKEPGSNSSRTEGKSEISQNSGNLSQEVVQSSTGPSESIPSTDAITPSEGSSTPPSPTKLILGTVREVEKNRKKDRQANTGSYAPDDRVQVYLSTREPNPLAQSEIQKAIDAGATLLIPAHDKGSYSQLRSWLDKRQYSEGPKGTWSPSYQVEPAPETSVQPSQTQTEVQQEGSTTQTQEEPVEEIKTDFKAVSKKVKEEKPVEKRLGLDDLNKDTLIEDTKESIEEIEAEAEPEIETKTQEIDLREITQGLFGRAKTFFLGAKDPQHWNPYLYAKDGFRQLSSRMKEWAESHPPTVARINDMTQKNSVGTIGHVQAYLNKKVIDLYTNTFGSVELTQEMMLNPDVLLSTGLKTFTTNDPKIKPDEFFRTKLLLIGDVANHPDWSMTTDKKNTGKKRQGLRSGNNWLNHEETRLLNLLNSSGTRLASWAQRAVFYGVHQVLGDPQYMSAPLNTQMENMYFHSEKRSDWDKYRNYLAASQTGINLQDSLSKLMSKYMSLKPNPDAPMNGVEGIYQALALEVMTYLEDNGLISREKISMKDVVEDTEKNVWFYTKNFSSDLSMSNVALGMDQLLSRATNEDVESGWVLDEPPRASRVKINGGIRISPYQSKIINDLIKNNPHKIDTPFFEHASTKSSEEIAEYFYPKQDERRGHIKKLETINTQRENYKRAIDEVRRIEGEIVRQGKETNSTNIYYKIQLNASDRYMYRGSINPQSNSLLREFVLPTHSDISFSNPVHMEGFARGLIQAMGSKAAKMDSVTATEKGNEIIDQIDQMTQGQSKVDWFSQEMKERLIKAFGEKDFSPLMVHAAFETHRMIQAIRNGEEGMNTSMYLELDGIHSGPVMMALLFHTGGLDETFLNILRKGGITLGNIPVGQADIYRDPTLVDIYAEVGQRVSEALQESGVDLPQALVTMMTMGVAGITFNNETGSIEFDRSSFKDLVMISTYGAGNKAMSNIHVSAMLDSLYDAMHRAQTGDMDARNEVQQWEDNLNALLGKKIPIRLTKNFVLSESDVKKLKAVYKEVFADKFASSLDLVMGRVRKNVLEFVEHNQKVEAAIVEGFRKELKAVSQQEKESGTISPQDSISVRSWKALLKKYRDNGIYITERGRNSLHIAKWHNEAIKDGEFYARTVNQKGELVGHEAKLPQPVFSGVSLLPKLVQGMGDARLLAQTANTVTRSEKVHDGNETPITEWTNHSQHLNRAVVSVWNSNLYQSYQDSLEQSQKALGFEVPEETIAFLRTKINERSGTVNEMNSNNWSIDHMGGGNSPYLYQGSKVSNQFTEISPDMYPSWVRSLNDYDAHKDLFETIRSATREAPTIRVESVLQEGKGGWYDRNTNTIHLVENSYNTTTVIHELIHAATHQVMNLPDNELKEGALIAKNQIRKIYRKLQQNSNTIPEAKVLLDKINSTANGNESVQLMELMSYGLTEGQEVLTALPLVQRIKGRLVKIVKRLLGIQDNELNLTSKNAFESLLFNTLILSRYQTNQEQSFAVPVLYQNLVNPSSHLEYIRDGLKDILRRQAIKDNATLDALTTARVLNYESDGMDSLAEARATGFNFDPVEASTYVTVYSLMSTGQELHLLTDNKDLHQLAEQFLSLVRSSNLNQNQKNWLGSLKGQDFQRVFTSLILTNEFFQNVVEDTFESINQNPYPHMLDSSVLGFDPSTQQTPVHFETMNQDLLDIAIESNTPVHTTHPKVIAALTKEGWKEIESEFYAPSDIESFEITGEMFSGSITYDEVTYPSINVFLDKVNVYGDLGHITSLIQEHYAQNPELLRKLRETGIRPLAYEDQGLVEILTETRRQDLLSSLDSGSGITDLSPKGYAQQWINILKNKLVDKRNVSTKVQQTLDALEAMVEGRESSLLYRAETASKALQAKLDDKGRDVLRWASQKAYRGYEKLSEASFRGNQVLGIVPQTVSTLLSEERTQEAVEAINNILMEVDWIPQDLHTLISELTGKPESTQDILGLMKKHEAIGQQTRQLYRQELPALIESWFRNKPSKGDWNTMTEGLMRMDMGALSSDIATMIQSKDARQNRMEELKQLMSSHQLEKADQLAYFMYTRIPGKVLLRNAHQIAGYMGNSRILNPKPDINLVNAIDEYVSLKAIHEMDVGILTDIQRLFEDEPQAMNKLVRVLGAIKKYNRNKTGKELGFKGHVPLVPKTGQSIVLVKESEWANYENDGWIQKEEVGSIGTVGGVKQEKMAYYWFPADEKAGFASGLLQDIQQSTNGVYTSSGWSVGTNLGTYTAKGQVSDILLWNPARFTTKESPIPVYTDDGYLKGFERIPDDEVMEILEPEKQLHALIGITRGRMIEEKISQELNTNVLNQINELFQKDNPGFDPEEPTTPHRFWVNILDESVRKKDPILEEAFNMIPNEVLKYSQTLWGEGNFYIRKDLLTQALGYRQASIRDIFSGQTRINKEYAQVAKAYLEWGFGIKGNAHRNLVRFEKWLQEMVGIAKSTIVVKSVLVPVANIISNVVQLKARGVSPIDSYRFGKQVFKEIQEYEKNRKKGIDLQTELLALPTNDITNRTQINRQIDFLKARNRNLSIWSLIEAGEYSTIKDGMNGIEEIRRTGLVDWFRAQLEKTPDLAQKIIKNTLMMDDSAIFQILHKTVQYGDFVAKGILNLHWKQQGESPEWIRRTINQEFVDYSLLPGRTRGVLEQNGMAWFLNYTLRMMPVVLNIFQRNPVSALFANMGAASMDLDNPVKDIVIAKAYRGVLGYSFGPGQGINSLTRHPLVNLLD